jgi:hypothetical protein
VKPGGASRRHIVKLTAAERKQLSEMVRNGQSPERQLLKARILLRADQGWRDADIARALNANDTLVYDVRRRSTEGGLEAALLRKPCSLHPEALCR